MASAKEIEKRKAILRARGVPEKFIDNIARRKGPGAVPFALAAVLMALVLAAIALPILLDDHIEAFLTPYLYPQARPSLLFYSSHGLGPAMTSVSLFLTVTIYCAAIALAVTRGRRQPAKPFPAFDSFAVSLRGLRENETLESVLPDIRFTVLDHLPDDAAFLDAARPARRKANLLPLLLGPAIFGMMIATQAGAVFDTKTVGLDAIRIQRLGHETTYLLKDAKLAYVVCYSGPDNLQFDYRIIFHGRTISLKEWRDPIHGLDDAGVIDRIDQIDRQLNRLNVPVYRMPRGGSPAIDGTLCVARMSRSWTARSADTLRRLVFG